MEYRKLAVGTRLRVVNAKDISDELRNGDIVVLEEDDGTDCPYRARCERTDDYFWFGADDVELATPDVPFRKVVTLTTDDGIGFTLSGDDVTIARDEVVAVPLATLIAAVDELRKHTK